MRGPSYFPIMLLMGYYAKGTMLKVLCYKSEQILQQGNKLLRSSNIKIFGQLPKADAFEKLYELPVHIRNFVLLQRTR